MKPLALEAVGTSTYSRLAIRMRPSLTPGLFRNE
jgi:hypothetical protein